MDCRVELKVLDPRLHQWGLPRYQTGMAAAVDLLACLDAPLELHPGTAPVLVSSGIAVHIANAGLAAMVLPPSGRASPNPDGGAGPSACGSTDNPSGDTDVLASGQEPVSVPTGAEVGDRDTVSGAGSQRPGPKNQRQVLVSPGNTIRSI